MKLKPKDIFVKDRNKIVIDAGKGIGIELTCPTDGDACEGAALIRAYIQRNVIQKLPDTIEEMVDLLVGEPVQRKPS